MNDNESWLKALEKCTGNSEFVQFFRRNIEEWSDRFDEADKRLGVLRRESDEIYHDHFPRNSKNRTRDTKFLHNERFNEIAREISRIEDDPNYALRSDKDCAERRLDTTCVLVALAYSLCRPGDFSLFPEWIRIDKLDPKGRRSAQRLAVEYISDRLSTSDHDEVNEPLDMLPRESVADEFGFDKLVPFLFQQFASGQETQLTLRWLNFAIRFEDEYGISVFGKPLKDVFETWIALKVLLETQIGVPDLSPMQACEKLEGILIGRLALEKQQCMDLPVSTIISKLKTAFLREACDPLNPGGQIDAPLTKNNDDRTQATKDAVVTVDKPSSESNKVFKDLTKQYGDELWEPMSRQIALRAREGMGESEPFVFGDEGVYHGRKRYYVFRKKNGRYQALMKQYSGKVGSKILALRDVVGESHGRSTVTLK